VIGAPVTPSRGRSAERALTRQEPRATPDWKRFDQQGRRAGGRAPSTEPRARAKGAGPLARAGGAPGRRGPGRRVTRTRLGPRQTPPCASSVPHAGTAPRSVESVMRSACSFEDPGPAQPLLPLGLSQRAESARAKISRRLGEAGLACVAGGRPAPRLRGTRVDTGPMYVHSCRHWTHVCAQSQYSEAATLSSHTLPFATTAVGGIPYSKQGTLSGISGLLSGS
jgi:hypothetical protein